MDSIQETRLAQPSELQQINPIRHIPNTRRDDLHYYSHLDLIPRRIQQNELRGYVILRAQGEIRACTCAREGVTLRPT